MTKLMFFAVRPRKPILYSVLTARRTAMWECLEQSPSQSVLSTHFNLLRASESLILCLRSLSKCLPFAVRDLLSTIRRALSRVQDVCMVIPQSVRRLQSTLIRQSIFLYWRVLMCVSNSYYSRNLLIEFCSYSYDHLH